MRAAITGGTGFVGARLAERLTRPIILSRDPVRAQRQLPNTEARAWDPERGVLPSLTDVDTIFHLAGESVASGRWTEERKRRIRDSRVLGTRHLIEHLRAQSVRPKVLVVASAIGYYGDRGDELLHEDSGPGSGFLADVCKEWEAEAKTAEALGIRVVSARIGIVIGEGGGALAKMMTPFKLGVGGRLASGRQWMSWVHLDDVVAILEFAATNDSVRGAINAVSPHPVTNAEFTRALGSAVHRPTVFPVPGAMLKLVFGEFGETLLGSARVTPRVAVERGYRFVYPELDRALAASLGQRSQTSAA